MNDNYSAASGQGIYAGRFGSDFDAINAIATTGVISNIASSVSAAGFTLLTTAIAGNGVVRNQPHSGACWDEARKALWFFGAETHGVASDYDNSVYVFDTRDGLFKEMYEQSPYIGEYNIGVNGYLYADLAGTKPWAVHTYNRLVYDNATREIKMMVDGSFHFGSGVPQQLGTYDLANRQMPEWRFNTVTGRWNTVFNSGIQSFNTAASMVSGAAYHPVVGWLSVSGSATGICTVSPSGEYNNYNVFGKINGRMHSHAFIMQDLFVLFGMAVEDSGALVSFSPIYNITASYRKNKEDYPVLSGWYPTNKQSIPISESEILFLCQNNANEIGAFIYNIDSHTVTDTGHRIYDVPSTYSSYNFRGAWSKSLNAAILLFSTPLRAFILRL